MRKRNSRYYKSNKLIQYNFSFPSPLFSCPPVLKSQEWDESSLKGLVYLASNAINVMYEVPQDHSDVCSSIFRSCEVPVAILGFFSFLCYAFCCYTLVSVQQFYCIYSLLHWYFITFNTFTSCRVLGVCGQCSYSSLPETVSSAAINPGAGKQRG